MADKPRCHFCGKNHPLKYCKVFKSFGINARRASIINKGWCLNCLAYDHVRFWCSSYYRCGIEIAPNKICNARHHSLLHREIRDPYSSSFEEKPEDTEQDAKPSSSTAQIKGNPAASPTADHRLHEDLHRLKLTVNRPLPERQPNSSTGARLKWPILPPLVRVNLNFRGQKMYTNFYVDPNAEQSYLLQEIAELLPGFTTKANQPGEQSSRFKLEPTYPHQPKDERLVTLVIKEKLDIKVPPAIPDPAIMAHFELYKPLAHPLFNTCRDVDGVLGRGVAERIFLPNIEAPLGDGPYAQLTIFGWMISGLWKNCSCHPRPGEC